jgi:hypothetical protein
MKPDAVAPLGSSAFAGATKGAGAAGAGAGAYVAGAAGGAYGAGAAGAYGAGGFPTGAGCAGVMPAAVMPLNTIIRPIHREECISSPLPVMAKRATVTHAPPPGQAGGGER